MKRSLIALLSVLSVTLLVGGCLSAPKAPREEFTAAVEETYSVRYYPNNSTGGTVPEDRSNYPAGATVVVQGNNEGTLVNSGFSFNGWNTKADGLGTTYDARGIFGPANFTMEAQNAQLYAVWADPLIGLWNLTSVNDRALILAPKGFQEMTLLIKEENHSWTIISSSISGLPTPSTGSWIVGDMATKYSLISGNIVVFSAVVNERTLTLKPTSLDATQVMVFTKQ